MGLGMIWRTTDVIHVPSLKPFHENLTGFNQ